MLNRIPDRRLITWLRLLDARAVSAPGGEGLFLAEGDDFVDELDLGSPQDAGNKDVDEVYEALHDALSRPGFVFFQKVQSFMGRISLIDKWHRGRNTVEDETEVMHIASKISRDLNRLFQQRPPLMDLVSHDKLMQPHLSEALASSITRCLRTYLANYYASFIHLHRVAYVHLPRTQNVYKALSTIRQMARMMVGDAHTSDEPLPVNMLWPLLMWGSEEDSQEERVWIISNVRKMGDIATNASITADVLEEVQKRQDATKARVDIRSVMQDIFNSSFAIV